MRTNLPTRTLFDILQSHGIILVIAIGLWWILSQSIEEIDIVEEKSTLEAIIDTGDPADAARFRVLSVTVADSKSNRPALRVSGPRQEISTFESDLDNLDTRGVRFRLKITADDLKAAAQSYVPVEHQTLVVVPLERFTRVVPEELRHEIQLDFADATKNVEVLLEDIVERFVVFKSASITPPRGYRMSKAEFPTTFKVRGPWSSVRKLPTTPSGEAVAEIDAIDLSSRIFPDSDSPRRLSEPFRIIAPSGVEFLEASGEKNLAGVVNIDLTPSLVLETWSQQLQVGIKLPYWLIEKQPELSPGDILRELTVRLKIDPSQRARFNEDTVKVELDLTDLDVKSVEAAAERRGERGRFFEVSDRYLGIRVLDKSLIYDLPEEVKEERYFKLNQKINLVWEE